MAFTIPHVPTLMKGGNNTNILDKVLGAVGSKGGQTLINAAGAGMAAYGQNKQAEADRAMTARQFAANMAQRQLESDRDFQQRGATAAANADPLGANQQFAQRNALLAAILPGLRNFSSTPGDPRVAAAMGKNSGGLRLPEGGLPPEMLERLFGDAATQASIAQRSKEISAINPNGPAANIESLYGQSADGSENAFQTDVNNFRQSELDRQLAESAKQRELIRRAIDEDINGTKASGGSSKKGKLAKAGVGAATGFATGGPIGALIGGIAGLF